MIYTFHTLIQKVTEVAIKKGKERAHIYRNKFCAKILDKGKNHVQEQLEFPHSWLYLLVFIIPMSCPPFTLFISGVLYKMDK